MPNRYDLALRERAVTAYERGDGSYARLAALFDVDHRTLERWVARWRDTQSLAPQPRGGGWPCPIDVTVLRAVVRDGPDATVTALCWEYSRRVPWARRTARFPFTNRTRWKLPVGYASMPWQCTGVSNVDWGVISHAVLYLGREMLVALAVGAVVGLATGRSRVAQWLTIGATAAGGIGAVLAAWVVIPGIPSTGGTMPHHYLPYSTAMVLAYTSFGLLYLTPLVLGFVIGSVNAFKRDKRGWRRFGLCALACVSVLAIGFFLLWVVGG